MWSGWHWLFGGLLIATLLGCIVAQARLQRRALASWMGRAFVAESGASDALVAASQAERKHREVVALVESIQGERDHWRKLYYVEAVEHGNAQARLMAERETLVTQLRRAGVKPRTDPMLDRVVEHHRREHVEQVPAGAYERARGLPAPEGTASSEEPRR